MTGVDEQRLTLSQIVALRRVHDDSGILRFSSTNNPIHMGNAQPIAYGGCALALSVHAAYQSIPRDMLQKLRIYSVFGNYLGPTALDHTIELEVTSLRDTRSFATRSVIASQLLTDPKDENKTIRRRCMHVVVDFIATLGTKTMLTYSVQPQHRNISHYSELPDREDDFKTSVKKGEMTQDLSDILEYGTKPFLDLCIIRIGPEGVLGPTYNGFLPDVKTSQDHLALTDKYSFDWTRPREWPLANSLEANNEGVLLPPSLSAAMACYLAFLLDGSISFTPLGHSKMSFAEADACSSLDCALRFHVDDIASAAWTLREISTMRGADERVFGQANLYREQSNTEERFNSKIEGLELIATMSQMSILRGDKPDPMPRLGPAKL